MLKIKKTLAILLAVCFVLAVTAAAVSAAPNDPNDGKKMYDHHDEKKFEDHNNCHNDTTAPTITTSGKPVVLWPPNHQYQTVSISDFVTSVTDNCDASVGINSIVITSVSSDEPEDALGEGDGNTTVDIVIKSPQTVDLRSERQGDGNGRVYTINYKVTDASGNTATGSSQVWVPHDQGNGATAVDDGAAAGYTVNYP
jgi:hypothetical protein